MIDSRCNRILRVLSSTVIGSMIFCLALPVAIIVGALLIKSADGCAYFSPQEIGLFLTSTLVALTLAVQVGMKYHWYLEKQQ